MSADSVISAFTAEHATKITGLTPRQLSYWGKLGFFKPSHSEMISDKKSIKFYSFKDIVGLRVLSVLQKEHKLSLQKLRRTAENLREYSETPWSNLRLMVCNGEVVFIAPSTGFGQGAITGQYVMVPIIEQIEYVQNAAAELNHRSASQIGAFERKRNVAHNAQVIAGTRVPVRAIQRFLAAGYTVDKILIEYPSLTREDIDAVIKTNTNKAAA